MGMSDNICVEFVDKETVSMKTAVELIIKNN